MTMNELETIKGKLEEALFFMDGVNGIGLVADGIEVAVSSMNVKLAVEAEIRQNLFDHLCKIEITVVPPAEYQDENK